MQDVVAQVAIGVLWTCVALLAYAYVGYAALVGLLSLFCWKRHAQAPIEPRVSLLIPAHNERRAIRAKVENSLATDYASDKRQIRVISDGSDDGTDEIVREYESRGVELQRIEPRAGKPNAVNSAVPHATGEVLLLCDANTMFAPDAVRRLVRHFADPRVGAVTGDVRLAGQKLSYGRGESLFWRQERFLQRCESRIWTSIGVDGGMYAVRKALFVPNRPDTLIDDFVIAMNVARTGARVVYDGQAVAVEDSVEAPAQEFRRRVRTVAGGYQSLLEGRGRPKWNQPLLWTGYLSHKVLRWLGPFLLVLLLASSLVAVLAVRPDRAVWPAYVSVLGAQVLFYLLGGVALLLGSRRLPAVLAVPYYFCLGNAAAMVGFVRWLRGSQPVTWAHADRHPEGAAPPLH